MSEKKIVTAPSGTGDPGDLAPVLHAPTAVKSSIEASSVLRNPCSRIRLTVSTAVLIASPAA